MGQQDGGNPRFKSAGTQWKSSWKGRVPFTEMCCIDGFNQSGITGNWYQDLGGVLPLVPASGFFISAVVGIGSLPLPGGSGTAVIASNGDVADEGWELYLADAGVDAAGDPTVAFGFRVYGGAGVVADRLASIGTIGFNPSISGLDPQLGVTRIYFRIFAWFEAPGSGGVYGAINIAVEGGTSASIMATLTDPYVNSTPRFKLGVGQGVNPLLSPNCLQGIVGGDGVPSGTTVADINLVIEGDEATNFPGWVHQVGILSQLPTTDPGKFDDAAENQIVAPDGGTFVPTLNPTNGWRANNPALPIGDAPDPLEPFLGPDNLEPAFPLVFPRNSLDIECSQPTVFWSQTANGQNL